MQEQIPRRIIQTGTNSNQNLRHRAVASNLRLLNPDFEYMFFDDRQVERFLEQEFPQYSAVFRSFYFEIQRYDFFRYLVVYRYGGFYFDLDMLLASGLSPLLQYECVFPFERLTASHFMRKNLGMDWQIGNYAFGAAAEHSFLEAVIENCVRGQRNPDWVRPMMRGSPPLIKDEFYVINSTGPGLVSRTFAEDPGLAGTVTILFPDDVCEVRNWDLFGDYGVHLKDSSWRRKRGFVSSKVTNYCWGRAERRNIKESRKLGKVRVGRTAAE